MNTKEKILSLLEEKTGEEGSYVSGSYIAENLGISRNAVWKSVQSLSLSGYKIQAVRRLGYRLLESPDRVSAAGIIKYLSGRTDSGSSGVYTSKNPLLSGTDRSLPPGLISVVPETASTNDLVREAAVRGEPEGFCAVAEHQSGGRGRRGRNFFSPKGSGIYFSLLLRPGAAELASHVTSIAAVAVCKALEDMGAEPGIKWVNDIFVGGKKVCGILAEATTSMETGEIDFVSLGIGINLFTPEGGFPNEIKDIAGSVFSSESSVKNTDTLSGKSRGCSDLSAGNGDAPKDVRNRVVAGVYRHFFEIYGSYGRYQAAPPNDVLGGNDAFAKLVSGEYKKRCFVIGKNISVIKHNSSRRARAVELGEDCSLLVQYEDGSMERLYSGEISIQLTKSREPSSRSDALSRSL